MNTEASQADISKEIEAAAQQPGGPQPRRDYPPYRSSALRHPRQPPQLADPEAVERSAPCFGRRDVDDAEADLTIRHAGSPIGERIVVTGRVLDGAGRPVVGQLVEVWQANAAGRYRHRHDQHPAPLDPNFTGAGRCRTGPDGWYRFQTIKPGPYPWRNHHNAWRPAHLCFSVFGAEFAERLVTQMYFPGDPLLALDPIHQSITDPAARARLVAAYDHEVTTPEWSTGYRWDIPLAAAPGQTVGPFFDLGLAFAGMNELVPPTHPRAIRLTGRVLDGDGQPVPDAVLEIWQLDPQGHVCRAPGSLRRDGWTNTCWGRAATDADGVYTFSTLEPGAAEPGRAPFFAVTVFARGVLDRLFTRAYLPVAAVVDEPLLAALPAGRRSTLIARRDEQGLVFDVRLQGNDETVFLSLARHAALPPAG